MTISFSLARAVPADAQVLGVPVFAGGRVGHGAELDPRFLAERGFEGRPGETLAIPADDGTTVVAIGMGDSGKVDADALRRAAAALVKAAWKDTRVATTLLDAAPAHVDRARVAQTIAEGAAMASYRFTRYKSDGRPCRIESLVVVGTGGAGVRAGLERGARVGDAVCWARDVSNEPAGALTPRRFAELASDLGSGEGLAVTVLDEVAIANEGLGGLLGVSRGSDEPPRLIELVYEPPGARATIALVGKGITFDSGGLSLKSADGMETMKTDMSGAAAVIAAMSVLPALAPNVKVIGLAPTTENMPGGRAIKPGDVLKIRNGTTVEVLNTDAEGRLVLADALSLAVEAGADAIVDIATLTGGVQVALGKKIAGLMGNDDALMARVRKAADRAGEPVWPLPLPDDYRRMIDSDVADIKNTAGRWASALTAGLFLREFVGTVPWAHLDIAGPARADSDDGYTPKGPTGFGVRTLVELVSSFTRR